MIDGFASVLGALISGLVVDASEQQIIDRAVMCAVELLPISWAGVTLVEERPEQGRVAASDAVARSLEQLQTRMNQGPCLVARAALQACLSPDVGHDPRFDRYGPAAVSNGAHAVFAFPLRYDGRLLGVIDLYRATVGGLSDGEAAVAQVLSDAVAAFLVNARARLTQDVLVARLRAAANRDALTGLPDRVLLLDRLGQALRRSARSQSSVAVAFIDLDGFKAVNDRFGHRVGDGLLIALSQRLGAILRPADTLARWGGDEFVLVIEDLADPHELDHLLARLDAQLVDAFEVDGMRISISMSRGAAISDPGDSTQNVIEAADQAMYAHKRERREPFVEGPSVSRSDRGPVEADDLRPQSDGWRERWIEGPTANHWTAAHVIAHVGRGELLITELDDRALVVMRHEWLPSPTAAQTVGGGYELIVTDWDGQEIERRVTAAVPDMPHDHAELTRLIGELDGG